ncbi:hypothetical protein ACQEUU_08285 [Nonomuraea sp. CA-218870]|uniref:hypothetical protein n=1 Tax=Nonomuraea sp. CA-218870 TaxID=3239998 RepID=UPI003D922D9D
MTPSFSWPAHCPRTHRSKMPGADAGTPLYAVSRAGCAVDGIRHVTPGELLEAWR